MYDTHGVFSAPRAVFTFKVRRFDAFSPCQVIELMQSPAVTGVRTSRSVRAGRWIASLEGGRSGYGVGRLSSAA